MSASEQIKRVVDLFKREPQLKDKTDGMAEGLLLGAQLADESNERSKDVDEKLKQLQQEYTENGNGSQTTAEINIARDGEQVLADRLRRDHESVTAQLDHTTQRVAGLQTQVTNMGDGSPKGAYETLTELESAFPSGADGVYVVTADGNWYYWNGTAWTAGGQYQSTGISAGSITIDDVSFVQSTNNLFDGNYQSGALAVAINPWSTYKISGGVVAVIPVENNSTYYIRKFQSSGRFRIAGSIALPDFSNADHNNSPKVDYMYTDSASDSGVYAEITTQNENYLIIQVSSTSQKPNLHVIKGVDLTTYQPPKVIKKEFIPVGTSVYKLLGRKDRINFDFKGNKIEVKGIIFAVNDSNYIPLDVQTLDISAANANLSQALCVDDSGILSYTVADDYQHKDNSPIIIGIFNKSEESVSGIDLPYLVNGKAPVPTGTEIVKPHLFGDFYKLYKTEKITDVSFIPTSKVTDVYSRYDELLNAYPNIITKNLLGYGSDANGSVDTNLPIYEYAIANPSTPTFGSLPNLSPTFLITTGTHGDEKSPVWGMYYFLKQMLANWHSNDTLASIKSNASFKIIPVLNPGGYNDVTRRNRHNVDLNRNFNYNWSSYVGSEKGTAPYSEPETVIARDWMAANTSPKAIYIDYHNTGEDYGTSYISTHNSKLQRAYASLMKRLTDIWNHEHGRPINNNVYGWVESSTRPMAFNEARHVNDILLSSMLEIAWDFNGTRYTPEVFERSVDLLANYILSVLNIYNELDITG